MNEDLDKLMELVDNVKDLSKSVEKTDVSQKTDVEILIKLGQQISDMEHRIEKLEEENIYLRAILKQQFGGNT